MEAPVVGLTTYRQVAAWGVWNTRADLLPTEYAASVEAAGGVPLLLPPVAAPGAAARVVSRIDALVVSGGADVDPDRYGAQPHARTAGWRAGPRRLGAGAPRRPPTRRGCRCWGSAAACS